VHPAASHLAFAAMWEERRAAEYRYTRAGGMAPVCFESAMSVI
jgi:hypothetical protein